MLSSKIGSALFYIHPIEKCYVGKDIIFQTPGLYRGIQLVYQTDMWDQKAQNCWWVLVIL